MKIGKFFERERERLRHKSFLKKDAGLDEIYDKKTSTF